MEQGAYSTYEIRQRALDALQRGMTVSEVAETFGVDRTMVYRWRVRVDAEGEAEAGLETRPRSGRPRLLEQVDEAALRRLVLRPASRFGVESDLRTVRRLQRVIVDRFRVELSHDTVWRRLRDAGLSYQKPERQYFEADEAARQRWLRDAVPMIRATVQQFRAVLYFQDEANVSLTAFLGKTWAPIGETPTVRVTGNRGSVSAVSAINRQGGLVFRLFPGRIASTQVIVFLQALLDHHPRRHVVVVMDQASPHVSKKTRDFIDGQPRLHVFYLPPYSPDFNPDEKVWSHLKSHELKAHQAKNRTELQRLTNNKLLSMSNDPALIRGLFFRCYVAELFG